MAFTPGRHAARIPARMAASMDDASVPSSTISSTLFTPSGTWDSVTARSVGSNGSLVVATMFLRSEEHTSELQSLAYLVCRLLLEKKTRRAPSAPRSEEHPLNYLHFQFSHADYGLTIPP